MPADHENLEARRFSWFGLCGMFSISFMVLISLGVMHKLLWAIVAVAVASLAAAATAIYFLLRQDNKASGHSRMARLIVLFGSAGIVAGIRALNRGWSQEDTTGVIVLAAIITGLAIADRQRAKANL